MPKEPITEINDPFAIQTDVLQTDNKIALSKQTILTPTNFSITGQRIFRVIASLIKDTDEPYKTYRFKMDEFNKVFGLKASSKINYNIDKALNELGSRINLKIAKGRLTSWILTSQLYNNEVQVTIDPVLLPLYQMAMQKQYKLLNIKNFKNNYTFKFYEYFLLRVYEEQEQSHKNVTVVEMGLDEIHEWLKLENKYTKYADLKKRVILPMLKDINDEGNPDNPCNLRVTYIEKKSGRKVETLIFTVTKLKEAVTEVTSEFTTNEIFDNLSTHGQVAFNYFKDILHVTRSTIEKSIEEYGEEVLLKVYTTIKNSPPNKQNERYAAQSLRKGWFSNNVKVVNSITKNKIEQPIKLPFVENQKEELPEESILDNYENKILTEKFDKVKGYLEKLPEEEKEHLIAVVKEKAMEHYPYFAKLIKDKSYNEIFDIPAIRGLVRISLIEELDNIEELSLNLPISNKVLAAIEKAKEDPDEFMTKVRDYVYENHPKTYEKYCDVSFNDFMSSDCKRHLFYKIVETYLENS